MPLYTYRCTACEAEFEQLVRSGDTPACPECQGTDLRQLLSRPARPGKTSGQLAAARRQAAAEGHFSNYSSAERTAALRG